MAEEVRPHTAIIIIIEPEWRAAPRLPNRLPSRLGPAESSGGGGRGNGEEGDDGNVLFDVASVRLQKAERPHLLRVRQFLDEVLRATVKMTVTTEVRYSKEDRYCDHSLKSILE